MEMKDFLLSRFDKEYDAVVIGAGIGGLMAGCELAYEGKRTLILEQHNLAGGFATSFVRGRYEFEATLHEILDVGTKKQSYDVRKTLDRLGVKYEFEAVPEAYVLIVPEEDINVCVPFGINEFIECMEKESPGVKKEVTRYMELCKEMYEAINYMVDQEMKGKLPNIITVKRKYPNFIKYSHMTIEEVEKEFELPNRIKSILHAYWCYQGPSVDALTFLLWGYMLYGYIYTGAYIPANRSHALSTAIAERTKELGGQIEYNCKVEKIHVENNKVIAVELKDGTYIKTKCVLSNAHPELVYGKMITPLTSAPEFSAKKTNAAVNTCSSIAIYLGLDANPEELGIKYYEYFITNTMDTRKIYDSLFTLNPEGFLSAICLDNAIPGATGEGRCQLTISWLVFGDIFKDVSVEDYEDLKTRFGEEMIDIFEKTTGAKIRDHIEEVEMVTPITWNRYTGAYKGQVFGHEQTPWNSAVVRLAAEKFENKKEVSGLYFVGGCSQSTHGYTPIIRLTRLTTNKAIRYMGGSK